MEIKKIQTVDRRIRKTKKVLKEGLAELLLQKKINDITVQELVNLADVNRGTFYLHYRDIYDMLSQIEAEMMDDLETIAERYSARLLNGSPHPYISAMLEYIGENLTFCKMLLGPYGDMAFVERLKKLLEKKVLSSLMEDIPEIEPQRYQYFASYTVAGCIGLVQTWMESGMHISPQDLAQIAEGMIQNGIEFLHREAKIIPTTKKS